MFDYEFKNELVYFVFIITEKKNIKTNKTAIYCF